MQHCSYLKEYNIFYVRRHVPLRALYSRTLNLEELDCWMLNLCKTVIAIIGIPVPSSKFQTNMKPIRRKSANDSFCTFVVELQIMSRIVFTCYFENLFLSWEKNASVAVTETVRKGFKNVLICCKIYGTLHVCKFKFQHLEFCLEKYFQPFGCCNFYYIWST